MEYHQGEHLASLTIEAMSAIETGGKAIHGNKSHSESDCVISALFQNKFPLVITYTIVSRILTPMPRLNTIFPQYPRRR